MLPRSVVTISTLGQLISENESFRHIVYLMKFGRRYAWLRMRSLQPPVALKPDQPPDQPPLTLYVRGKEPTAPRSSFQPL